jgi:hypothetical protein
MNAFNKDKQLLDDDARFDRLVDGELSADEYKSLIAGLDDEPGGWRRCALAFLEAQALGGELTAIRHSGQLAEQPAMPVTLAARKAVEPARWKLLMGMSASFLVAFILGVTLPSLWRLGGETVVAGPDVPVGPTDLEPATSLPDGIMRSIGSAQLVLDGPGGTLSAAGQVPLFEGPFDATSRWLSEQEPALPTELVNELKRRGHRVERQEQYVPVSLEDGREGMIPVESYQITPVSRRAY